MAPAMKPPATPAPTAQPKQPPASAGLGAASAAAPIDAAAARASRVFFMAGLLEGAGTARSRQESHGKVVQRLHAGAASAANLEGRPAEASPSPFEALASLGRLRVTAHAG